MNDPGPVHGDPQPPTELRRLRSSAALSRLALKAGSLDELLTEAARQVAACLNAPEVGIYAWVRDAEPVLQLRAGLGFPEVELGGPNSSAAAAAETKVEAEGSASRAPRPSAEGWVDTRVEIESGPTPFGALVVSRPAAAAEAAAAALGRAEGAEAAQACTATEAAYLREIADVLASAIARRRVEDSLRSSEQRLAMAQEIAQMGSYDWEIATDTNIWSDELYRIYGCEPQSFNASYAKFLSFIHPDDREKVSAVHRKAYADCQPYKMVERVIRPNGEERVLESNGRVITDEAGRPVRMVGICFDVTERRRVEEQALAYARTLHDAEMRRKQALEINDNVVQGLTAVVYALEAGHTDMALEASRATLQSARGMMHDLLGSTRAAPLNAGDLVREKAAPAFVTRAPAAAPKRAAKRVRVVLADDSDDLRMLIRMSLDATADIEVVGEAWDGKQAVDIVDQLHPDVAVVDLAMPVMDGLEAIAIMRERSPATKVIALSGFSEARMKAHAAASGCHAYLEKGASIERLTGVIHELCARAAS